MRQADALTTMQTNENRYCRREIFLARTKSIYWMAAAAIFAATANMLCSAQSASHMEPVKADPAIQAAVRQISPQRVHDIIEKLVSFGNRSTLSSLPPASGPLPAGQGVLAAADWIEAQFRQISAECNNCLEVKRDSFVETPQSRIIAPTPINNIYAVLRGSDPAQADRRVLVTGHYDSRNSTNENTTDAAPGANDDASGVAVVLECARVLSKLKMPATVVFVTVAGEEQGLNGSRHLAKLAKSEGWKLEAVLNNDIVGGDTTPGDKMTRKDAVRVFSEGIPSTAVGDEKAIRSIRGLGTESDSPSRELARAIVSIGAEYPGGHTYGKHVQLSVGGSPLTPVMEMRPDRYLRGGDHTSFNQEGFAAVRFSEWRENFNHQHQNVRTENGVEYGDLLKFVDTRYVANVARVNAATLAVLASAPGEPRNVKIVTKELDNNSTLTWEAPEGAPADTQYEVVWRTTADPDWTNAKSVKGALTITLPVSKDNVFFGVRSVDPAGHRSIAVPPVPAR